MDGGEGNDIMVGGPGVDDIKAGNNTVDENSADFIHSFDGNVETVCVGTGDNRVVLRDLSDTIKGPRIARRCSSAQAQAHSRPEAVVRW